MPVQPDQETGGVGPAVLDAAGISKSFAGVHALREVDFAARAGEVHALIGENGAGKSTLIKVLTGVYRPDVGRVRLGGTERSFHSPLEAQSAGISTIYQEVNLVPLMSVARNLYLGREPRRLGLIDLRAMHRQATETLERYGVRVDVTRPLHSLGLGVQQMVALARAVQLEARVVIMDEPTSSLEPRAVRTLFSVIRTLREQGIAVVFVSHRLDELYEICDRVTVLRDGRVVHTGALAGLDRLRLISLMLGREVAAVRKDGATAFDTSGHAVRDGQPALRAEGLTVRHRLHGVSLDVHPGEVVGLGGLLGAGRSETAKAIIGALATDGGSVEVDGRPLRRRNPASAIRAGVVMLAEDRKSEGIIPSLSVRENIVLAALPRMSRAGIVSAERQDAVVKLFMDRLRIKASGPEQRVSDLSGGNQQKVLLARWLCMNPKVLLISSELEELIEGSDRVVVLRDGAVVGHLEGAEVTEEQLIRTLAAAPDGGGGGSAATAPAGIGDGADEEQER